MSERGFVRFKLLSKFATYFTPLTIRRARFVRKIECESRSELVPTFNIRESLETNVIKRQK